MTIETLFTILSTVVATPHLPKWYAIVLAFAYAAFAILIAAIKALA